MQALWFPPEIQVTEITVTILRLFRIPNGVAVRLSVPTFSPLSCI
jgi:hypothetical protein